jgi:hypothetical protein
MSYAVFCWDILTLTLLLSSSRKTYLAVIAARCCPWRLLAAHELFLIPAPLADLFGVSPSIASFCIGEVVRRSVELMVRTGLMLNKGVASRSA